MGLILMQAKQDQLYFKRHLGHALPNQPPFGGQTGVKPVQPQNPPAPIIEQRGDRVRIAADMVNAVQRRPCKAGRHHQTDRL